MPSGPSILRPDEIAPLLGFERLIPAIAQGFRDYYRGSARVAPITNIDLADVNGEMHIKPGYFVDGEYVCVKVATCYYDNPRRGLPTRDGAMLLADRNDGRIVAILCDAGRITDMRTAAASAVAVDALAKKDSITLGLVGAGTQAYWHARALAHVRTIESITLWGRDSVRATRAAQRIGTDAGISMRVGSLDEAAACDVVVTATPAPTSVLTNERLKPGALIVAMGADANGKRELGDGVIAQADVVVADSIAQCKAVGELQWLDASSAKPRVAELGAILCGAAAGRISPRDVIVFDSTGMAFQDVVGSTQVLSALVQRRAHE